MGLPGSGKTTLAERLISIVPNSVWFNADKVREQFDDWDFSPEGRIRQSERMKWLAENCPSKPDFVLCDFVAPTKEIRKIFGPDILVWMDTITEGRFEDTNKVFESPDEYDFRIRVKDSEVYAEIISSSLKI